MKSQRYEKYKVNIRYIDPNPEWLDEQTILDWYFVTKNDQQFWVLMEDDPINHDYVSKKCWFVDQGIKFRFLIGDYGEEGYAKGILANFRPDVIKPLIFEENERVILPWDVFWDELIEPNIDFMMELYEDANIPNEVVENRWKKDESLEDFYDKWWLEKTKQSQNY